MIALAVASSLIHPTLFGAIWTVMGLWCLGGLKLYKDHDSPVKTWLLAFGPLLLLYSLSAIVNGLSIGRVEALEPVLGGALLAIGSDKIRFLHVNHKHLIRGLVIALVGGLVVALYEMLITGERRAGMVFQPINFGIGIGTALLLLVLLAQDRRTLFFIGLLAGAVTLLLTGSRGPILFFVVSAAIGLWLQQRFDPQNETGAPASGRSPTAQRLMWAGLVIGFVILGVVVSQYRLHLEAVRGEPSSHGIRWELIRLSLAQIAQTPWFGIGADQAGKFFSQFPPPIETLNHAHVTILNLALELGVFGALAWLWAFGVLIWFFIRQRAISPAGIWQAGVAITLFMFLCSMTQDIMSHSYTRKMMALAIVLLMVMCSSNRNSTASWQNPASAQS